MAIIFLLAVALFGATVGDVAVGSPSVIAGPPTQPKVISVAGARVLPPGTSVTVEGSVTVPSGAFKSSTSDEGFAVQDASGGIYVRMTENLGLRVGRRARVTGKLDESKGLLVIVPTGAASVEALGRGRVVKPQAVSTGKINEATEGKLVKVTGTITKPVGSDPPYGFRLFVDDGAGEVQVFVSASTGINQRGLRPGARVRVTGFSGQYQDHYEIGPRFQADVKLIP